MISDETDNHNDVNGAGAFGKGTSSGRVATNQYAPGRYRDTGCDNLSLSSNSNLLQETESSDLSFSIIDKSRKIHTKSNKSKISELYNVT